MTRRFSLFSLAIVNLKRKPFRTAVLVAAIGLLVSGLVFALSFVARVNAGIKLASDRLGADIIIVPAGSRGAAENVLLENITKTFYMDKGLIDRVRQVKGIGDLTYQTYLVSLIGLCCDVPETTVVAFNQDTDFVIKPWLVEKLGRRLGRGEAIVGSESAMNIQVGLTDVESTLFGNLFKMVGVLEKTGTGLDTAMFIDEANIEDILRKGKADLKPGQISIIFVKVKKGEDPYKVAGDIEDSIIEVDAVARKDIGKSILTTLRDINRIFMITIGIASVLSVLLAWSVFSAIAGERSREVGLMRAIGAKESHVLKLFFLEVFVIGAFGSLIGIVAGTGISLALGESFKILQGFSSGMGFMWRFAISVTGFAAGTTVCVLAALFPVFRVKKLDPLIVVKGD